jgi:hypothetical protein
MQSHARGPHLTERTNRRFIFLLLLYCYYATLLHNSYSNRGISYCTTPTHYINHIIIIQIFFIRTSMLELACCTSRARPCFVSTGKAGMAAMALAPGMALSTERSKMCFEPKNLDSVRVTTARTCLASIAVQSVANSSR